MSYYETITDNLLSGIDFLLLPYTPLYSILDAHFYPRPPQNSTSIPIMVNINVNNVKTIIVHNNSDLLYISMSNLQLGCIKNSIGLELKLTLQSFEIKSLMQDFLPEYQTIFTPKKNSSHLISMNINLYQNISHPQYLGYDIKLMFNYSGSNSIMNYNLYNMVSRELDPIIESIHLNTIRNTSNYLCYYNIQIGEINLQFNKVFDHYEILSLNIESIVLHNKPSGSSNRDDNIVLHLYTLVFHSVKLCYGFQEKRIKKTSIIFPDTNILVQLDARENYSYDIATTEMSLELSEQFYKFFSELLVEYIEIAKEEFINDDISFLDSVKEDENYGNLHLTRTFSSSSFRSVSLDIYSTARRDYNFWQLLLKSLIYKITISLYIPVVSLEIFREKGSELINTSSLEMVKTAGISENSVYFFISTSLYFQITSSNTQSEFIVSIKSICLKNTDHLSKIPEKIKEFIFLGKENSSAINLQFIINYPSNTWKSSLVLQLNGGTIILGESFSIFIKWIYSLYVYYVVKSTRNSKFLIKSAIDNIRIIFVDYSHLSNNAEVMVFCVCGTQNSVHHYVHEYISQVKLSVHSTFMNKDFDVKDHQVVDNIIFNISYKIDDSIPSLFEIEFSEKIDVKMPYSLLHLFIKSFRSNLPVLQDNSNTFNSQSLNSILYMKEMNFLLINDHTSRPQPFLMFAVEDIEIEMVKAKLKTLTIDFSIQFFNEKFCIYEPLLEKNTLLIQSKEFNKVDPQVKWTIDMIQIMKLIEFNISLDFLEVFFKFTNMLDEESKYIGCKQTNITFYNFSGYSFTIETEPVVVFTTQASIAPSLTLLIENWATFLSEINKRVWISAYMDHDSSKIVVKLFEDFTKNELITTFHFLKCERKSKVLELHSWHSDIYSIQFFVDNLLTEWDTKLSMNLLVSNTHQNLSSSFSEIVPNLTTKELPQYSFPYHNDSFFMQRPIYLSNPQFSNTKILLDCIGFTRIAETGIYLENIIEDERRKIILRSSVEIISNFKEMIKMSCYKKQDKLNYKVFTEVNQLEHYYIPPINNDEYLVEISYNEIGAILDINNIINNEKANTPMVIYSSNTGNQTVLCYYTITEYLDANSFTLNPLLIYSFFIIPPYKFINSMDANINISISYKSNEIKNYDLVPEIPEDVLFISPNNFTHVSLLLMFLKISNEKTKLSHIFNTKPPYKARVKNKNEEVSYISVSWETINHTVHVYFYYDICIYNRTDTELFVKANDVFLRSMNDPIRMSQESNPLATPKLSNSVRGTYFSLPEKCHKIKISLDESFPKDRTLEFDVNLIRLEMRSNISSELFDKSISIISHNSNKGFYLHQIIEIVPKFVIWNQTNTTFFIKQRIMQFSSIKIGANESKIFNWPNISLPNYLALSIDEINYSGDFEFYNSPITVFIPNSTKSILLSTQTFHSIQVLVLQEYDTSFSPYIIANETFSYSLFILEKESNFNGVYLLPYTTSPYHWHDPGGSHKLQLTILPYIPEHVPESLEDELSMMFTMEGSLSFDEFQHSTCFTIGSTTLIISIEVANRMHILRIESTNIPILKTPLETNPYYQILFRYQSLDQEFNRLSIFTQNLQKLIKAFNDEVMTDCTQTCLFEPLWMFFEVSQRVKSDYYIMASYIGENGQMEHIEIGKDVSRKNSIGLFKNKMIPFCSEIIINICAGKPHISASIASGTINLANFLPNILHSEMLVIQYYYPNEIIPVNILFFYRIYIGSSIPIHPLHMIHKTLEDALADLLIKMDKELLMLDNYLTITNNVIPNISERSETIMIHLILQGAAVPYDGLVYAVIIGNDGKAYTTPTLVTPSPFPIYSNKIFNLVPLSGLRYSNDVEIVLEDITNESIIAQNPMLYPGSIIKAINNSSDFSMVDLETNSPLKMELLYNDDLVQSRKVVWNFDCSFPLKDLNRFTIALFGQNNQSKSSDHEETVEYYDNEGKKMKGQVDHLGRLKQTDVFLGATQLVFDMNTLFHRIRLRPLGTWVDLSARFQVKKSLSQYQIKCLSCPGIGVSLINRKPEDICYIGLRDIQFITCSEIGGKFSSSCKIKRIQVDNPVKGSSVQVILFPIIDDLNSIDFLLQGYTGEYCYNNMNLVIVVRVLILLNSH